MKLLTVLLVACPLCACIQDPAPASDAGSEFQDSWEPVATYENPSLSEDGEAAHEALTDALRARGIHAVAAGSRGYTLSVAESQLEKAREIVKELIESEELEAQLVE